MSVTQRGIAHAHSTLALHVGTTFEKLNEQIAAYRTPMRERASEGQDVRDHERILQLMIETQALAMMHRHLLLK